MLSEYDVPIQNKEYFVPCGPNSGKELKFSSVDQMIGDSRERFNFMYENVQNKEDFTDLSEMKSIISQAITKVMPNLSATLTKANNSHAAKLEGRGYYLIEIYTNDSYQNLKSKKFATSLVNLYLKNKDMDDDVPLIVQVVRFQCGSTILSLQFSHLIVDGCSFNLFLKAINQIASGDDVIELPTMDDYLENFMRNDARGIRRKEFIFIEEAELCDFVINITESSISKLQAKVNEQNTDLRISKNDCINILFLRALTRIRGLKHDIIYRFFMNIRGYPIFRLQNDSIGNGITVGTQTFESKELLGDIINSLREMRQKIKCVNEDKVIDALNELGNCSLVDILTIKSNEFLFSSLKHYGYYTKLDFGYGSNTFLSSYQAYLNLFYVMPPCKPDTGFNIYSVLHKSESEKFVNDFELKEYINWTSY